MASRELRWFDSGQPQTLQGAVILCYLNAVFGLIGLLQGSPVALILVLEAVAGLAIANQRRWGYWLGVVVAVLYLATLVLYFTLSLAILLNLAFAIVLVALLLHRQSRAYQRVWFH